MKSKFILSFLALSGLVMLFWSNAGGPASVGDSNYSGSSGSTCANCHSGGSFAPITTIDIKDSQGNSVTTVMGDSTYDITVSISASGSPSGYGFQAIVVDDSTNANVGTLSNPGSGVQISTLTTNEQLAEHSSTSSNSSFSFSWTAPSTGSNTFRIYAYGNAVNGNGGTSGDAAAGDNISLDFIAAQVSSLENKLSNELDVAVFPNPVVNQLNVKMETEEAADYNLGIFSTNGQQLRNQEIQANSGENQFEFDVTDLPVGAYRLVVQDEQGRILTKSFVKF